MKESKPKLQKAMNDLLLGSVPRLRGLNAKGRRMVSWRRKL